MRREFSCARPIPRRAVVGVSVRLDLQKIRKAIGDLRGKLEPTVAAGMRSAVGLLVNHVTRVKLSGSTGKRGVLGVGAVLRRQTGTLIRSITASPRYTATADRVVGIMGSNLDYAKMHELGYSGPVTVPAHRRRAHSVREHVRKMKHSGAVARVKAHRVRAHQVREHIANVHITAKHYLRDTLREKGPEVSVRIHRALILLRRTGRVPSQTDLLREPQS